MAAKFYNRGLEALLSDRPWLSHAFQVILVTDGYTFNKDHDVVNDLTPGSNEASGTGYLRLEPTSKTLTVDDTNDRTVLDCADFAYTAINTGGSNIAGYVIAADTGDDAVDELILFNDQGGFPKVLGGSDFQITHHATEGIGYFNSP